MEEEAQVQAVAVWTRRSFLSLAVAAGVAAMAGSASFAAVASQTVSTSTKSGGGFPALARISVPPGALSISQRQSLIRGVTDVLAKVAGLEGHGKGLVTVLVTEVAEGGWGVGGHGYTHSELPGLVQGKHLQ